MSSINNQNSKNLEDQSTTQESTIINLTKNERHQQLCEDIHNMYVKKNAAYGDSFSRVYDELGLVSAVTQISHKYHRLINLVKNPDVDNIGESIEDTLIDMANYCMMTYLEMTKDKN